MVPAMSACSSDSATAGEPRAQVVSSLIRP
jgi:hypothetical protein